MDYALTDIMETLFRKETGMVSLYSREDLAFLREQVRQAEEDNIHFIRASFERACQSVGLAPEELLAEESLLQGVPTRAEVQQLLLDSFHTLCREAPAPAAYMERVVRRLSPEFPQTDSVRLVILKKFLTGSGFSCGSVPTGDVCRLALERMTEEQVRAYRVCPSEQEKMALLVSSLGEDIFSVLSVRPAELTRREQAELMLRRVRLLEQLRQEGRLFDGREQPWPQPYALTLRDGTCRAMGVACAPAGDAAGLVQRWLDSTGEELPEDGFLLLKEDFTALLKRTRYQAETGERKSALELYRNDRRDLRKRKQARQNRQTGDWTLLKQCADLAQGRFTSGAQARTRLLLYQFAFMFGMKVPLKGSVPDAWNFEKNLLQDYYADNLIRFYEKEALAGELEQEPEGFGINYKNYAEAVLVYFLMHEELGTPGQRLDRAWKTIRSCGRKANQSPGDAGEQQTRFYRSAAAAMLELPPDRLELFVRQHFEVQPVRDGNWQRAGARNRTAEQLLRQENWMQRVLDFNDRDAAIRKLNNQSGPAPEQECGALELLARSTMDRTLFNRLRERWPEDVRFCAVVEQLEQRFADCWLWTGEQGVPFLLTLLRTLRQEKKPVRIRYLKEREPLCHYGLSGRSLLRELEWLQKAGFPVQVTVVGRESRIWLDRTPAADSRVREILNGLESPAGQRSGEERLQALLQERGLLEEGRVSRTALLISILRDYLSAEETLFDEAVSLTELYEDFRAFADETLETARCQRLSMKNITDLFLVLYLFEYAIQNGR